MDNQLSYVRYKRKSGPFFYTGRFYCDKKTVMPFCKGFAATKFLKAATHNGFRE
jgi:hypothetical protein